MSRTVIKMNITTISIALLGILWVVLFNPGTVISFYTSLDDYHPSGLLNFVLFSDIYVFALTLAAILFRKKKRVVKGLVNNAVLISAMITIFFLLKMIDLLTGVMNPTQDLIFLPNSSAHYLTTEFDYTAKINKFGFRGPELDLHTANKPLKVMLLGDSFTFGWGLEYDSSWGALVENSLRAQGLDIRVYNLGKPGADPADYEDIARRAIPVLKPQLVIVNILQSDDLFQTIREPQRAAVSAPHGLLVRTLAKIREYFKIFFPKLNGLLFHESPFGNSSLEVDITPNWKSQSEEILENFTPEQKVRYNSVEAAIQKMFLEGQLNPKMIYDAVKYPRKYLQYENINSMETKKVIEVLATRLKNISDLATRSKSKVVITLVPYPIFVGKIFQDSYSRFGFEVDASLLSSDNSEFAVRLAAESAGLPFYSPLALFRSLPDKNIYYPLDAHFNAAGAEEYSKFITKIISENLTDTSRQ
jgi:hypothetical protein